MDRTSEQLIDLLHRMTRERDGLNETVGKLHEQAIMRQAGTLFVSGQHEDIEMANTMLDAADARIASLEADKADLLRVLGIADEKIRSGEDARGQYIRENAALEARCRELERQVEIGKDFCVAAPLASHDEPEVVADCEVCQWQSKMNDWYMANEPLETPWKCPRCHNLGFHSATGENYCTACANHFLHGHPDPLRSTAETSGVKDG